MNSQQRTNPSGAEDDADGTDQCGIVLLDANLDVYHYSNLPSPPSPDTGDTPRRIPIGRPFFDTFPSALAVAQFVTLVESASRGNIDRQTVWFTHPVPFPRTRGPAEEARRTEQGVMFFRLEDPQRPGHFGLLVFERAVTPTASLCINAACNVRQFPESPDTDLRAELEKTRQRLLQSEKMAAVGQLAAGVAHEINNPVGYVSSNLRGLSGYILDLLRLTDAIESVDTIGQLRQVKRGIDYDYLRQDIESLIAESREGLDRVKRIIDALKDFSHHEESESFCPADLHRIIETTISVVNNEVRYRADIVREFGDIPPVACVASQINQVVANLLVNAAQAMPEYGRITVRTGMDDGVAWFEVEDTGTGIAPDLVDRIFEPFFTTKPAGEGTGLGLSLSWNIVQKHHGRIEVVSTPGQGTRFRVWLPITQAAESSDNDMPGCPGQCGMGPACKE